MQRGKSLATAGCKQGVFWGAHEKSRPKAACEVQAEPAYITLAMAWQT